MQFHVEADRVICKACLRAQCTYADGDSGKCAIQAPRAAYHFVLCHKKLTLEFILGGPGQVCQQEILVFLFLLSFGWYF